MALDVSVSTRDGEIVVPVQQRPAPPCVIVIFGASGDLTHRKLIPALWSLYAARTLPGAVNTPDSYFVYAYSSNMGGVAPFNPLGALTPENWYFTK